MFIQPCTAIPQYLLTDTFSESWKTWEGGEGVKINILLLLNQIFRHAVDQTKAELVPPILEAPKSILGL
jgi:hypothetical protein